MGFQSIMRARLSGALVVAGLAAAVPATGESALTPHAAEYSVKISILSGRLNTELRRTDTGFSATHVIKPTGMANVFANGNITETSEFVAAEDGVRPVHYVTSDTLTKDETDASVRFDWNEHVLEGTVNGEAVRTALEGLVHDRVSIQYELMHDLLSSGASDQYVLYDIDEMKTLKVTNVGRKKVSVPAGEFEAIGIQHQAENSSRVTTLWCVEKLGYLPVIVEQHRKGKLKVRAALTRYEPAREDDTPLARMQPR